MAAELSRENLLGQACTATGLNDFGDLPFTDPLDILIDALGREARLDDQRRADAETTLLGFLTKRLRLVNDRKKYPDIANETIDAPLVILGLPRTGSTHLHALMALGDGVRAPLQWEMSMPSPPPERASFESDPRIAQVQAGLDRLPAEMMARHPFGAQRPEQCIGLLDWSFMNLSLLASYDVPSYRDWLLNADFAPAYESHRRTLQHLQWRHPGQWVLKFPKHVFALDALIATYPDARVIWTHRDPGNVLPSVASFVGAYRAATPAFDAKRFGREWTAFEELGLLRGLATRDHHNSPAQHYDVHYNNLIRDPAGTVAAIYDHFGMEFSAAAHERLDRWMRDNPQTKHGVHHYDPEDFGLNAERLRARFRAYTKRFDIEPDRHTD